MEIRLSEKEITLGVVAYLNSRGMNVDPETANIEFTVSRKPAGVSAVLHEGPIPVAEPEAKEEPKLVGQAETSGALVSGEAAAKAPEPVVEQAADPTPEVVTEAAAEAGASDAQVTGTSLFA